MRQTYFATALAAALAAATALPSLAASRLSTAADPCAAPIPDKPLQGTISGHMFAPDHVDIYKQKIYGNDGTPYDSYYLTFRVGTSQDSLQVQPAMKAGTRPDGKTFRRLPTRDPKQQPAAGPDLTEIASWYLQIPGASIDTGFIRDLATLRLEFGRRKGGVLPGHLALCIPKLHAVIIGAFNAKILKEE